MIFKKSIVKHIGLDNVITRNFVLVFMFKGSQAKVLGIEQSLIEVENPPKSGLHDNKETLIIIF